MAPQTGRTIIDRPEQWIEAVRTRLSNSASSWIRVTKFNSLHKAALSILIDRGEVELFDGPAGRAYRFTALGQPKKRAQCKGITAKGTRCRSPAMDSDPEHCWDHSPAHVEDRMRWRGQISKSMLDRYARSRSGHIGWAGLLMVVVAAGLLLVAGAWEFNQALSGSPWVLERQGEEGFVLAVDAVSGSCGARR